MNVLGKHMDSLLLAGEPRPKARLTKRSFLAKDRLR